MRAGWTSVLLAIVAAATWTPGTWAAATTQPAADPVGIDSLIVQLGNTDYHVRRDASDQIQRIGPAAMPALRRATDDPNPEIRCRVRQIMRSLEFHHVPGRPRARGGHMANMHVTAINGQRQININDGGREIQISEQPGGIGIDMIVKGEVDGRPATERYTAHTAQQLREDNPEAYALYARWVGALPDEMDAAFNQAVAQQQNFVMQAPPVAVIRAGPDDLDTLRSRIDDQMKRANVALDRQRRIDDALGRLKAAKDAEAFDAQDESIHKYNDACDDLRKELAHVNLPDPGDALPPPPGARLGVSSPGASPAGGVVVAHVIPDSKADHMGVQEDDIIRKVNGKAVNSIRELRQAVTQHPHDLTLDISRDGQDLQLTQPK